MDENSQITPIDINKIIESNNDKAFSRLHKLQFLLKKESALKELCKILSFIYIKKNRYKNKK